MSRRAANLLVQAFGLRFPVTQQTSLQQAFGAAGLRAFATVEKTYKYNSSHEWAKVDGNVATIGISDHAQAELGDVVYVELPDVGKVLKKGDTFGVVESVKAASDVYCPVGGTVTEVNSALGDAPATVNKDPYKSGWIIKVEMSDKADLDQLLDAAAYEKSTAH